MGFGKIFYFFFLGFVSGRITNREVCQAKIKKKNLQFEVRENLVYVFDFVLVLDFPAVKEALSV